MASAPGRRAQHVLQLGRASLVLRDGALKPGHDLAQELRRQHHWARQVVQHASGKHLTLACLQGEE